MTYQTRVTLRVIEDQLTKDLAQAKSNYLGSDYHTPEQLRP
jgi:hypothetical protein